MIVIYSDDSKKGLELVKGAVASGKKARYLAAAEFRGPGDRETGVTEVWLVDGPNDVIQAVYGDLVVAKYEEKPKPSKAKEEPAPAEVEYAEPQEEVQPSPAPAPVHKRRGRKQSVQSED